MNRKYYAAHSNMGQFTYDSPCWSVHVFKTREERDAWIDANANRDPDKIYDAIVYRTACYIAPDLRNDAIPMEDKRGVVVM